MSNLGWYWERLRSMSVGEIGFRFVSAFLTLFQSKGYFLAKNVAPAEITKASKTWFFEAPNLEKKLYCDAADRIIGGVLDIFALHDFQVGANPKWNTDPLTGTKAPLTFGKKLGYRNKDSVGNIKYLWEPNRHLHFVTLAQAYKLSGEKRYLNNVLEQLNSWIAQCPYPLGANWVSSLELAIRLINWSIVWGLIGGADSPAFRSPEGKKTLEKWTAVIFQHMHFIRHNLSRFSSANNHLIGELTGLFVATTIWPCWKECERWNNFSYKELVREGLHQNALDGVNCEQAISYQQFVADFLLIAALVGQKHGLEFPLSYLKRIESMLEYLASVMDVGSNVPMIGDADDGFVVRLSQEPEFCPYRSLLATGAILYKRGDLKAKSVGIDHKTSWLLGKNSLDEYAEVTPRVETLPIRRAFRVGGYYILGQDFESDNEIRLIVDAGPLGFLSIAAHGHSDALAFTLSVSGKEILLDPGTYTYSGNKSWRNYFRGTAAHNTLRVDGLNQSVIGGDFLWTKKAVTRCGQWEEGDRTDKFSGTHDGYMRLTDPVRHTRELILDKSTRKILVTDTLECASQHLVECFWHFSEQCNVSMDKGTIEIENNGTFVQMKLDSKWSTVEQRYGSEEKPGGWVSRRFDVKEPSSTVVTSTTINGTISFSTEIHC